MPDFIYLYQSVSLSPISTVIPQHIIISLIHCIGYTHFLQPFAVTPSEMHCHAIRIHTN
jgi:hypothetical protein